MVSLLNKSFRLKCHKVACHTTEYILSLDIFSWTTSGVWDLSSTKRNVIFSLLGVFLAIFSLIDAFLGLQCPSA